MKYLIEGLQNRGHSNFLMSPKNSALSERSSLPPTHQLVYKNGIFTLLQNIVGLKKYCDKHQIDIVHGHDSHAHTLLWLAYKYWELHTKSVVTRRLMNPIKSRSLNKYNFPKIERIICISDAVKKALAPSIQDHTRLAVIHSSIEITSPLKRIRSQSQSKEFVVGYVAAFTQEKDHETFIETAKYLKKQFPNEAFKFLLIGDGPLLQKIKKKVEDVGVEFTFTGFVEDIEQAYSKIDLILHTSKSEALGTAILDAMKYGIPVVATKTGGIPEIIVDNQNGFLCQKGDFKDMGKKVHMLSSDKNLRDRFVENGYLKLKNFDNTIMVDHTFALYQNVLKTIV